MTWSAYGSALAAGAESLEAPLDTPYGDRRAMVRDLFGNVFQIAAPASAGLTFELTRSSSSILMALPRRIL